MDFPFIEPGFPYALRTGPEAAQHRLGRDLHITTLMNPALQPLGLVADQTVALGMRDDRQELRQVELVESFLDRGRDGEVGKLDEKVVLLIDRVVPGLRAQGLEVFVTQMEVTARGQNQAISQAGLEFTLALLYQFGMEWEAVAGVGGAHDMGDSIGD